MGFSSPDLFDLMILSDHFPPSMRISLRKVDVSLADRSCETKVVAGLLSVFSDIS